MIVDKLAEIFVQTLNSELAPTEFPREKIIDRMQLNSVDALQILINVENNFDIEIDDDDLNSELIDSLYTLEQYVNKKISKNKEVE